MFISSDQALEQHGNHDVPRHFMVISKPCQHPDAAPREGYIRGNYESVEFIREIPVKKAPLRKSTSTSDLAKSHSRNKSDSNLGKEAVLRNAHKKHDLSTTEEGEDLHDKASRSDSDIAQAEKETAPSEDDEWEHNPVEWIMVTRSDPGGSVPRFMIDRGTPSAIVSDAGKFLDWACSKTIEDLDSADDEEERVEETEEAGTKRHEHRHRHRHNHESDLHNYQTNGHLAGMDSQSDNAVPVAVGPAVSVVPKQTQAPVTSGNGLYDIVAGAATTAGALIAPYAPAIIADHLPHSSDASPAPEPEPLPLASEPSSAQFSAPINRSRSVSVSSFSTESTVDSFESALSFRKISSHDSEAVQKVNLQRDKELQKLEEKKRKLQEKLEKAKQKEAEKKSGDGEKEREAVRKAEEKHDREVKKREEKYKKEMEKLEKKRIREEHKQDEKRRKREEKEKGEELSVVNASLKADIEVLKREREVLRDQVGSIQRENTLLVGRLGRLGVSGEDMLREVREELAGKGSPARRRRGSSMGSHRSVASIGGVTGTESLRGAKVSGENERQRERNIVIPVAVPVSSPVDLPVVGKTNRVGDIPVSRRNGEGL